eukprot:COSAG02_NODE_2001_length_10139_cov_15.596116_4_plen_99_part_00
MPSLQPLINTLRCSACHFAVRRRCLARVLLTLAILSSPVQSCGVQWAEFRDAKHDLFQQTGGDMLLLEGGSMETLLLTDGGASGFVPPTGHDREDEAI